jgi:small subunit ribosomal protein S7e
MAAAAVATLPARKKLKKSSRANPTDLEEQVAQAIFDLEIHHKNLKAALTNLTFNTAKEIEISPAKKALVIFFPLRFIRTYRKIQKQLTSELEKKFSGKHVIMLGQRKIARKPKSHREIQRSRTMQAVHEAILDDIVYPCDIVGKRTHVSVDGSQKLQIYFDQRDKDRVEGRLETFSVLYKKLTGKDARFGFMSNPQLQQFV